MAKTSGVAVPQRLGDLTVVDGRTAGHPGDPTLADYWMMLLLKRIYLQPPLVQMRRII